MEKVGWSFMTQLLLCYLKMGSSNNISQSMLLMVSTDEKSLNKWYFDEILILE